MLRMRTHISFPWFWYQCALRLTFLIVRMHAKASRLRTRMVETATNPQGYHVHAGEVLKRYTPDKNQATPARYYMSGQNLYFDISHSYG